MKFLLLCEERLDDEETVTFNVVVQNWRHVRSILRSRGVFGITKSYKRYPKHFGHKSYKRLVKVLESTNED